MRPLVSAAILSVGSELTTGETRDTNAGDLARDLSEAGVTVTRLVAMPDDQPALEAAIRAAIEGADCVVLTGGLGPTPDDLTREAIAGVIGETPSEDPGLLRWLAALFERRGVPFAAVNRKQAWLVPSATSIPNDNGTAPGWWIDRPDGRVLVALPGPPREMRPMWDAWVRPRLAERGLGRPGTVDTLRTTGIGESAIAERLGPLLDRAADPVVATYARADAVDVRISSHERPGWDARAAVESTTAEVERRLEGHVWARGGTTWAAALAEALDARGWRLATVEVGTAGALVRLLADGLAERLVFAEVLPRMPAPHGTAHGEAATPARLAASVRAAAAATLVGHAAEVGSAVEVGLAVEVRARRGDTAVSVAIVDPRGVHRDRRVAFLGGELGRGRAAIAAASILLTRLREP